MAVDIDHYIPGSGRQIREDGTIVNVADLMADAAILRKAPIASGFATDATGVKLSYSPPAGKTAMVRGGHWKNISGTPTVQVQLVRGATTIVLREETADFRLDSPIMLEDGDTLEMEVTAAASLSSTADAALAVEEQE